MYIHLGADIEVRKKTIVAIFDLDNTSTSKITNEFFKRASKNNIVVNVSEEDLPRSYILTEEKGKQTLYISPISSQTLSKRANIFDLK
ncbi:MAG: DUF370 domain-containing protein [Ruminococcaceae bacterium]|nr:DUF370 domain-containing protein [Oscillospiraceae bacterium]